MFERKKQVLANIDNNQKVSPYLAKKSNRAPVNLTADNDTWVEGFAVVTVSCASNNSTNSKLYMPFSKKQSTQQKEEDKLVVRTWFESQMTGKKLWDEPPSGASNVSYASEEARLMAEKQLQRILRKKEKKRKVKKSKKSRNTEHDEIEKATSLSLLQNDLKQTKAMEKKKKKKSSNEEFDPLNKDKLKKMKKPQKSCHKDEEDVTLALAQALSLSEHEARQKEQEANEVKMLEEAIRLSKEEELLLNEFDEIIRSKQPSCSNSSSCSIQHQQQEDFFSWDDPIQLCLHAEDKIDFNTCSNQAASMSATALSAFSPPNVSNRNFGLDCLDEVMKLPPKPKTSSASTFSYSTSAENDHGWSQRFASPSSTCT